MDEPKVAQKSPIVVEVEPGKHAWCACGRSSKQPYCDGSHLGTGIQPLMEEVLEKKTVAWCGCKNSDDAPFCDGTHADL